MSLSPSAVYPSQLASYTYPPFEPKLTSRSLFCAYRLAKSVPAMTKVSLASQHVNDRLLVAGDAGQSHLVEVFLPPGGSFSSSQEFKPVHAVQPCYRPRQAERRTEREREREERERERGRDIEVDEIDRRSQRCTQTASQSGLSCWCSQGTGLWHNAACNVACSTSPATASYNFLHQNRTKVTGSIRLKRC